MLSYHNDPAVKAKYLSRVIAHRKADHLIQGTGWENGHGCAVGCTLEVYDHSRYPVELGLPEWLARLEDWIFERMPPKQAMKWPERFLKAIPVGVNVEPVRHLLAIRRLTRLVDAHKAAIGKHGEAIDKVLRQVIASIDSVIALHRAEADGKTCDWSAAVSAAVSAARSAAVSAAVSAARSAARSAESAAVSAESAAWSAARSAESAARSAAVSAVSAVGAARSAESAARSAAAKQEADDLIELLRQCAA